MKVYRIWACSPHIDCHETDLKKIIELLETLKVDDDIVISRIAMTPTEYQIAKEQEDGPVQAD